MIDESKMKQIHVIDVDEMRAFMTRQPQIESSKDDKRVEFPLIYKIKQQSCDTNEDVYRPNVLPIGPYHHTIAAKIEIEQMKWMSLDYLLKLNPKKEMKDYIEEMELLEEKMRSSYANEIKMKSNEFIKRMLLDGCCILSILHATNGVTSTSNSNGGVKSEQEVCETVICNEFEMVRSGDRNPEGSDSQDGTPNTMDWYTRYVYRDLLLLENQIPFFVVTKIYELLTDGTSPTTLLADGIADAVEDLIYSYPKSISKSQWPKQFHHLLHLCHFYFKPSESQTESNEDNTRHKASYHPENHQNLHYRIRTAGTSSIVPKQILGWHRAVEYQRAAIEIRKKELHNANPHSLLDIGFCDGIMEMPRLTIDPNTYCLFRNFVAFEQTCPQFGNYMTTYVVFLSQFIKTPEDVALLTGRGILVHQLDSDAEVCYLFRMLCIGVTCNCDDDNFLKLICDAMEIHYQIHRPKWRDWLGSITSKVTQRSPECRSDEVSDALLSEGIV